MADIEKVIKGLDHCGLMYSSSPFNPCYECPYKGKYNCAVILKREALELLKEQKKHIETLENVNAIDLNPKWPYVFNTYRKVVLCKDCVNRRVCVIAKKHDGFTDNKFDPDWFCADGERKNNG